MEMNLRETPFDYIQVAISEFKARSGQMICEIGCMRQEPNHGVDEPCGDSCPSRCDGHSTMYLAASGAYMWSIDIARDAVRVAAKHTSQFLDCHIMRDDGISFLRRWDMKVDLLFLDAWDVGQEDCAAKHLEAYEVARDSGRIHKNTIIVIDDTDVGWDPIRQEYFFDGSFRLGKGELVIPQATKDGYKVLKEGRCVILG